MRIPEQERDKTLKDKLLAEAPGILAWAVQGCLEWQQSGLGEPPEVVSATAGYREEMDTLGAFLTEGCIVGPTLLVRCSALYAEYRRWAEETGECRLSQRALSQRLQERGFRRVETGHAKTWCWQGLGLLVR